MLEIFCGYFDLYTTSEQPMNVYSGLFAGMLGYKDTQAAQQSVELMDGLYQQLESAGDCARQHHALLMALMMFNKNPAMDRCLVCSAWQMFLSSSFTDSMMALFLKIMLSVAERLCGFMFFLTLVISCMPSAKSRSDKAFEIYPLSPKSFPKIFSVRLRITLMSLSSTLPLVR